MFCSHWWVSVSFSIFFSAAGLLMNCGNRDSVFGFPTHTVVTVFLTTKFCLRICFACAFYLLVFSVFGTIIKCYCCCRQFVRYCYTVIWLLWVKLSWAFFFYSAWSKNWSKSWSSFFFFSLSFYLESLLDCSEQERGEK